MTIAAIVASLSTECAVEWMSACSLETMSTSTESTWTLSHGDREAFEAAVLDATGGKPSSEDVAAFDRALQRSLDGMIEAARLVVADTIKHGGKGYRMADLSQYMDDAVRESIHGTVDTSADFWAAYVAAVGPAAASEVAELCPAILLTRPALLSHERAAPGG